MIVRRLAAMPETGGLIKLFVEEPGIGDAGFAALLDSPHLANLKVLSADKASVTYASYVALAKATKTSLPGLADREPHASSPCADRLAG